MKLINKLDKYIIKQLLATFLLAIVLIILIIIVFDLSEKLDNFLQNKAPLKAIIFDYYVNFLPYFVNLFGHLFFFISVIFLSSRLATRTEIIAMLSSGISFNRILRPFLISSIFVALFNLYLSNYLIPQVNKPRMEFEKNYYKNPFKNSLYNVHIQLDSTTQVYVQSFNNFNQTGYRFTEEFFDSSGVCKKIFAEEIAFDSASNNWRLKDYSIRTIKGKVENLQKGESMILKMDLKPIDFNINLIKTEALTYPELNSFIERQEQRGSSVVKSYLVEKYQRLLNPIAFIILTVIGVSLSSRKTRGGTGIHLAFGITLAFIFIMMMKITTVFSTKGNLPPIISVLIPLIIFSIISLYLIRKAPK